MLSLGATWISDQPRYSWRAFLLLMIAALLLLTNIFTERFMAQDGTHMQEADVDKKVIRALVLASPTSCCTFGLCYVLDSLIVKMLILKTHT